MLFVLNGVVSIHLNDSNSYQECILFNNRLSRHSSTFRNVGCFFCGSFMLFPSCFFFFVCVRVRLFIDALWSPAGKGLTLALVCDV